MPFISKLNDTRALVNRYLNSRYNDKILYQIIIGKDTCYNEAFNSMISQRLHKSGNPGSFLRCLGLVGIAVITKNDGYSDGLLVVFRRLFNLKLTPSQIEQAAASDKLIKYEKKQRQTKEFNIDRKERREKKKLDKNDKSYDKDQHPTD